MHGSAKVEADPIMPAWPKCRGIPPNATSDQMPDSESCSEGYEIRLKEIWVRICISGEASVHLLSF